MTDLSQYSVNSVFLRRNGEVIQLPFRELPLVEYIDSLDLPQIWKDRGPAFLTRNDCIFITMPIGTVQVNWMQWPKLKKYILRYLREAVDGDDEDNDADDEGSDDRADGGGSREMGMNKPEVKQGELKDQKVENTKATDEEAKKKGEVGERADQPGSRKRKREESESRQVETEDSEVGNKKRKKEEPGEEELEEGEIKE